MRQFSSQKYVLTLLSFIVLICLGIWLFFDYASTKSNAYMGQAAVLTAPKPNVILQINNAVFKALPKIPSGIQFNLHITAFTNTDAKGSVVYSKTYPDVQFMAVNSGNKWIVIAHNTGKTLVLPDVTTAKKYNLPAGWYSNS